MSGKQKGARPPPSAGERRRKGVVIHDDRGNARLEWVDAPYRIERTSLSVEGQDADRAIERGYDPYASRARATGRAGANPERRRRDLRKLSEWIKQVRRVEALKRAESAEGGEEDETGGNAGADDAQA